MILDSLKNSDRYNALHPNFAAAFAWLKSQDLAALEPGTYPVGDGLKTIISDKPGVAKEDAVAKFECHDLNIDIQLCIRGSETMGWRHRGDCHDLKTPYNPEKDVQFFNDGPSTFFTLQENEFVIFFPEDVHAAMIGEGDIKKLVVKVLK